MTLSQAIRDCFKEGPTEFSKIFASVQDLVSAEVALNMVKKPSKKITNMSLGDKIQLGKARYILGRFPHLEIARLSETPHADPVYGIHPAETVVCARAGCSNVVKLTPVNKTRKVLYCSRLCAAFSRRTIVETECPICFNAFRPKFSLQKSCSRKCGRQLRFKESSQEVA